MVPNECCLMCDNCLLNGLFDACKCFLNGLTGVYADRMQNGLLGVFFAC